MGCHGGCGRSLSEKELAGPGPGLAGLSEKELAGPGPGLAGSEARPRARPGLAGIILDSESSMRVRCSEPLSWASSSLSRNP